MPNRKRRMICTAGVAKVAPVLRFTHHAPTAGHLGQRKTLQRIRPVFLAGCLLGRTPRGLLDIFKESLEAPPPSAPTSALAYLTDRYQRMTDVKDIAMYIERKAKATLAQLYALKAKSREFSIGDLVMILLPTSTYSLLACW